MDAVARVLEEFAQHGRQHKFADGFGCAYIDVNALRLGEALKQAALQREHGIRVALERIGGGGARELPTIVVEELHAVMPLQILNMLRNAGLRHAQRLGGQPVVHAVVQRQKGLDPVIEHAYPSLF